MARSTRLPALRTGLAGLALAAAGLAGWQQLSAQALGSFNSNAPVDFDAAKIELQDKANRVVLTGDVVIKQGDLTLRAARTTVAYTNTGSLQIQRLDAVGNVLVTRGNEAARGSAAVYDFNKRVIVMSGAVTLTRGGDTLNGGRLVIDLKTGLSSVDGRGGAVGDAKGGRVTGTFSVPKNST
ncbi:MAG: LptA/OstA family protein [Candidatus Andeanibacterium colombiense]|uniref:LptA/OstA family protein n=1 Tax=Candidatus Andeanibacterium colombiense TaxID=3121345 RepID=A0AAJ5X3L7_9SPHN|nr:MAG: LptA/OstA family protein [Sphingomonadaceae bacterium]